MFIGTSVLNANSVDPDQTSRSATSDIDRHCLPLSLLWEAGIIVTIRREFIWYYILNKQL